MSFTFFDQRFFSSTTLLCISLHPLRMSLEKNKERLRVTSSRLRIWFYFLDRIAYLFVVVLPDSCCDQMTLQSWGRELFFFLLPSSFLQTQTDMSSASVSLLGQKTFSQSQGLCRKDNKSYSLVNLSWSIRYFSYLNSCLSRTELVLFDKHYLISVFFFPWLFNFGILWERQVSVKLLLSKATDVFHQSLD